MSNAIFNSIIRAIHTFSSADFMFVFSRLFLNEDIRVTKSATLMACFLFATTSSVVHICVLARIVKCPGF